MSLRVPSDGVELEGQYASRVRDKQAPNAVEGVFCPDCGSRVIHRGRGASSGVSVKAGTLDDKHQFAPVGHIWAGSAQSWVVMDGLVYEGQPDDDYAALNAAFAARYQLK